MKISPDQTVVVAGNGPSLARIVPGSVLAEDVIFRTNSFFFEPCYYLGKRVDLAVMGGDPRVAPFVFETLWRCLPDYDLQHWTTHDPRVERAGRRRFAGQHLPMRYRDRQIRERVEALCRDYDRTPTTGIRAVLMAHALGAKRIVLAGIDLYTTGAAARYSYSPGRHYRALMGGDVDKRGADLRLHHPDLDREILAMLNAEDDVFLSLAAANPSLQSLLDPAPLREGTRPDQAPRNAPEDWAGRAGLYPIALMKMLRRASALYRGTFGAAPHEP